MIRLLKKLSRRALDRMFRPYFDAQREQLVQEMERNACLTARSLIEQQGARGILPTLREAEFRVFSQFGEDGIVQYLARHVPIAECTFIEFGVEDYVESNTRFLLVNNNWRGLILDGRPELSARIAATPMAWRHEITALSAFVTTANVNSLFADAGFSGDIGLLSIDVDGNDYWLWDAINVVSPRIVVCEYNSVFGCRYPVTVPYRCDFDKTLAHFSNLYFGASLPALCVLAERRGYRFVGSNSTGHNAFFVRGDVAGELPVANMKTEYVCSRFRSSLNEQGKLNFLSGEQRARAIAHLPVIDVVDGRTRKVSELAA